eukprot:TRINITY_DN4907_c0_g1_i2.p1 TRINITY_DN4907_c0_g1~~TRINITY_DN4907_c0_g1_i2.p1  ORF type:complete len:253 (+),score=46.87 TRINITY_DN4907_c0_g1_i2:23-760(+)
MSGRKKSLSSKVEWVKPDKEGLLKKQGHVVKNWKYRWFIVKNDYMFYFKDKSSLEEPLGIIPLINSLIMLPDSDVKVKNKPFCFEVFSPMINKSFYIQASDKSTMEEWVTAIKAGSEYCPIGTPFNIEHKVHVDINSVFEGLPAEWVALLKSSGIPDEEISSNYEALKDVLKFQTQREEKHKRETILGAGFTTMFISPFDKIRLPDVMDNINLKDLVNPMGTKAAYENWKKIGEGAAGQVRYIAA